jgi:hypothetical protein
MTEKEQKISKDISEIKKHKNKFPSNFTKINNYLEYL